MAHHLPFIPGTIQKGIEVAGEQALAKVVDWSQVVELHFADSDLGAGNAFGCHGAWGVEIMGLSRG
jgi:hypothetical protein